MFVVASAIAHVTVRGDRDSFRAGHYFGAVSGGGGGQPRGHRTHATDRDVPVTGAAAEQVIEEADVLGQRWLVEPGEGADQRVGSDHATNQVIVHRGGDGAPDRFLDHGVPGAECLGGATVHHGAAGLVAGA